MGPISVNQYCLFLRGINVGGKNLMPMKELQSLFGTIGLINIKTWLQSGNIRFESDQSKEQSIEAIEKALSKHFDYHGSLILIELDQLKKLIDLDPFKDLEVSATKKANITFSLNPMQHPMNPTIPQEMKFMPIDLTTVATHIEITKQFGTLAMMDILEGWYGKEITTRSWNTLLKMVK
jgi:uncharacterized protein (DUF1697 family)